MNAKPKPYVNRSKYYRVRGTQSMCKKQNSQILPNNIPDRLYNGHSLSIRRFHARMKMVRLTTLHNEDHEAGNTFCRNARLLHLRKLALRHDHRHILKVMISVVRIIGEKLL